MSAELIKQLQEGFQANWDGTLVLIDRQVCVEAASRIAELEAALEQSKERVSALERQLAERDADARRYQQLLCMSTEEAVELFAMTDIDAMEIQLDATIKAQEEKE